MVQAMNHVCSDRSLHVLSDSMSGSRSFIPSTLPSSLLPVILGSLVPASRRGMMGITRSLVVKEIVQDCSRAQTTAVELSC